MSGNDYFLTFLERGRPATGCSSTLGARLARQTVDILGNLPPEAVFFEQSPCRPTNCRPTRRSWSSCGGARLEDLAGREPSAPARPRPALHPGNPQDGGAVAGRSSACCSKSGRSSAPASLGTCRSIHVLSKNDYIFSETILNNIFFGKTKTSNPQAEETISQNIIQLLIERDLLETIVDIGMHYNVGSKGDNLSGGQRQKLAIARVFLKAPRMLIMDEATSALDNQSQARIQNLLETRWKRKSTLIAVVHRLDTIRKFDKIAVMKAGKIIEMGGYDELIARKGALYELVGRK